MQLHRIGAWAHKVHGAKVLIAGLGVAMGVGTATAQTPAAAAATGTAPSEAAQRQANSPYRFILQNANAPTRAKPAPAPAPAPAPVEARRPTPAPEQTASVRPAPTPVLPASVATPPAPVPTPVASIAPKAEPIAAVVKRDIIPIRTDDPRLPAALMRERPSGVVRVHFELNPDGSTGNVTIVSSTNRSLNRASVEAVSNWKFQPVDEVLSIETELAYKYD